MGVPPTTVGFLRITLVLLLFIQQQNREERQRQGLEEALGQCTLCGSFLCVCVCVYCSFTCHLTCTCSVLNRTGFARFHFYLILLYHIELSFSPPPPKLYMCVYIYVQQNHPYDTFSNFPGQAKEK